MNGDRSKAREERDKTMWKPSLVGRTGPKYQRILDALTEDVAAGALTPGDQLPPHRELAYALGVSATTTNRAYAEAVARGLLQGEVGRGTFVRAPREPSPLADKMDLRRPKAGPIDFSRNLPSAGTAAAALSATLRALADAPSLAATVDYQTQGDLRHHAEAGVKWLARTGVAATEDEIVVALGAQHGVLAALTAATAPGDLLVTEALTYPPVRAMAARLGLREAPAPMDEGGVCPDALEALCASSAPRALYLNPTLQTPTTITLSDERRDAIAAIARRRNLLVIEDDVLGPLHPNPPAPIASRAPEQVIYVGSVSKCLAPGLRVGFVRGPARLVDAIHGAVALTCWMPPPLTVEIVARWIADGTADRLTEAQRAAAVHRHGVARALLGDLAIAGDPNGLHMWLQLPSSWTGPAFRQEAALAGVRVLDSTVFAAPHAAPGPAIRVCLTHEPDETRLRDGLAVLRNVLQRPGRPPSLVL